MEKEETEYRRVGWRLEYRIYENAKRFVKLAPAGLARWANAEARMFSLVHMMVAIELLLKARIAHHDVRLLKKGSDVPSLSDFQAGKFFSLTVKEAIKILKKECGIHLSLEQKATIESLCDVRNAIVHLHGVDDDIKLAVPIADGLNFFVEFIFQDYYYENAYQDDARQMATDWTEYRQFCESRTSSLQEQLNIRLRPRTWYTAECSHCAQMADVLEDNKLICLFCHFSEPVSEYASRRSENRTSSTCPVCHQIAVMAVSVRGEIAKECFCCGCLIEGPEPEWVNAPRLRPIISGPL